MSGGRDGTPYTAGTWTNQNVTVAFACSDALSTVDTCDSPKVLKGESANQVATGSGQDKAGNTGSATFSNIDIDTVALALFAGARRPAASSPV